MNPLYEMFNQQYIQQQAQKNEHLEQVEEVQKSINALKDFLDSLNKIKEPYYNMAAVGYSLVIAEYLNKGKMQ